MSVHVQCQCPVSTSGVIQHQAWCPYNADGVRAQWFPQVGCPSCGHVARPDALPPRDLVADVFLVLLRNDGRCSTMTMETAERIWRTAEEIVKAREEK